MIPARHIPVRTAVAALVTSAAFGLAFPDRTDYLGHYLAGFAATLMLLSLVYLMPVRWRPTAIVVTTFIAIALGWGTESTIFKLAIFDPVDFNNQSLGAVVAGACVLGDEGPPINMVWALALGTVALIGGFYFAFA